MKILKITIVISMTLIFALSINLNAQSINNKSIRINEETVSTPTQRLAAIKPVIYNYNINQYQGIKLPEAKQYGFEINGFKSEFPELHKKSAKLIPNGKNNFKTIYYDDVDLEKLVPVLVAAFQEQQNEIFLLKEELKSLKKK